MASKAGPLATKPSSTCAAHGAAAAGLCCGPRYTASWRAQARTISRHLAALATRPSATAPRRLEAPSLGPKLGGGGAAFRIPNSEFRIRPAPSVSLWMSNRIGKVRRMELKTSFCDLDHDTVAALDLHCFWTHRTISSFTSPFAGLLFFGRFSRRCPRGCQATPMNAPSP